MEALQLVIIAAIAYLIGAIPSGLLVARLYGVDLLKEGSGKTGATNTLHALGVGAAVAVFALDLAKGVIAVLLPRMLLWPNATWLDAAVGVAGAAAIVGHNRSVWVRLMSGEWGGGRGIVTALGAMYMLHPLVVLVAVLVGALTTGLTRYMALGAMLGVGAGVVTAGVLAGMGQISFTLLGAAIAWGLIVIAGFSDNIERLLRSAEPRLGRPKP